MYNDNLYINMANASTAVKKLFFIILVISLMIIPMFSIDNSFSMSTANSKNLIDEQTGATYYNTLNPDKTNIPLKNARLQKPINSTALKSVNLPASFNSASISSRHPGKRLYKITFIEHGLDTGVPWEVVIVHHRSKTLRSEFPSFPYYAQLMHINPFQVTNSSNTNSISIFLSNGNYEYLAGPLGTNYRYNTFSVHGNSKNITLSFPKFYRITFTVKNLPSGIEWNVIALSFKAYGFYYYNISASKSMISYLPDGTYSLMAGPSSTYINQTSFKVNGTNIALRLKLPVLHTITFHEVNLHKGIRWYIFTDTANCTVSYENSSSNHSMTAYLPDGPYNYSRNYAFIANQSNVSAIRSFGVIQSSTITQKTQPARNPSFIIKGNSENITIEFPVTHKIVFSESNMPPGNSWSLSLYNKNYSVYAINYSYRKSMTAYLVNGIYKYTTFSSSPNYISLPQKEFEVLGKSENISIKFPETHKVKFTEINVPSGISWKVNLNYVNSNIKYHNTSLATSMTAYLPSGNYTYCAGFHGILYICKQLAIDNESRNITLDFPVTYKIIFTEINAPPGVSWKNTVYNDNYSIRFCHSSELTSMTAYLPNGTYNYCIYYSEYHSYISSQGKFTVGHRPREISMGFPLMYKVTFNEINVPSNVSWTVFIKNNLRFSYYNSSNLTSMMAYLPSGKYQYTGCLDLISYLHGHFTVRNKSSNITLQFPVTYKVTFMAINFNSRAGGFWHIKLRNNNGSINYSNYSHGRSMMVYLQNGTYEYTPSYNTGFTTISFSEREFSFRGKSLCITVKFPVTYNVTFKGTNVPPGMSWNINSRDTYINSCVSIGGSSSIKIYLPNGTYNYTGSYTLYGDTISVPVNFTVDGSSMKDNVIFPAIHKVTFIENNVTSGINWGIKLSSNGTCINYSHSTLSQSMTVYLPDGNYTYHAYYSNHSTCVFMPERVFTVHNTSLNFLLTFGTTYNVTFKEKGLPSWDFWCVTFHGIKKKSYNSTIIFPAVNGTYSYTVKNLSGYTVSSSNLVRVNGNNVTQEIIFKYDVKKTPFVLSRTEIYAAVGIIIVIVLITISIILIIRKNKYNSEL